MLDNHITRSILLVLSSLFFYSSAIQANEDKTVVVLDDSIRTVQGNPRPTPYEAYELGTTDSVTSYSIATPSYYNPASSFAQNVAAGVGIGLATNLLMSAAIETGLQNAQNKLIAPLRDSVNTDKLNKTSAHVISSKIEESTGSDVIKYYISHASQSVLPRILAKQKNEKISQAYIFKRNALPVVTLSNDSRQVIVLVEIERFATGKLNPKKNYSGIFAYTGLIKYPSENITPLDYWTANESKNFLDEIDNAFSTMIEFIQRNPEMPDKKSRNKTTMLENSGMVFQVSGHLLEIRGNNAYTIDDNDLIRIIAGQSITEHEPAAENEAPEEQS